MSAGARVVRASIADPLRVVALTASAEWLGRAEVLKRDGRSSVLGGRIDGLPVVVKCLRLDRAKDALARVFGGTRGLRQWEGAGLLRARGFATAETLVLFRGRDARGRVVETLVMERVEGATLLESVARGLRLARSAGALAGAMARAGVRNRDLKPSNVIVRGADGALVQIDTVGVRGDSGAGAGEMLFRLLVECVGVGVMPSRAERWRAVRAALGPGGAGGRAGERGAARALWREVALRLARHGDPRPKIDPLGRG